MIKSHTILYIGGRMMKKIVILFLCVFMIQAVFGYSSFLGFNEELNKIKEAFNEFNQHVSKITNVMEKEQSAVPELINDLQDFLTEYATNTEELDKDGIEVLWAEAYERYEEIASLAINHKAAAPEVLKELEVILNSSIPQIGTIELDKEKMAEFGIELKRINGGTFYFPVTDSDVVNVKVSSFYSDAFPINAYMFLKYLNYLDSEGKVREYISTGDIVEMKNGDKIYFKTIENNEIHSNYMIFNGKNYFLGKDDAKLRNILISFGGRGSLNLFPLEDFLNWLSDQFNLPHAYGKNEQLVDSTGRATDDIKKVKGFRIPTEAEWWWMIVGEKYRRYVYGDSHRKITTSNIFDKTKIEDYLCSEKGIYYPNYPGEYGNSAGEIMKLSINADELDNISYAETILNPIVTEPSLYDTERVENSRKDNRLEVFKSPYYNYGNVGFFFRVTLSIPD